MADATVQDIAKYFMREGDTLKTFSAEYKMLTDKDKADLKRGIGDGSYNY